MCVYNSWHTDLLSRISTTGIANASVFPDPVTCGRLEASEGRLHVIDSDRPTYSLNCNILVLHKVRDGGTLGIETSDA